MHSMCNLILLYTVMSSNSRVTRSKGKSDGLSLPARTRQRKKPTNMENDGNTALSTTFDMGSDQHHPQMPVHTSPLRCQSTPPRTDKVKMWETPVSAVSTAPHRPLTPHIPLLNHKILVQAYHKCLPLCLQKTDTVPALMMT